MPDAPSPATPPSPAALRALGSDGWASVLSAVRSVLARAPHAGDAELRRFREAPTSRMVGGPLRDALVERLSIDGALWSEVVEVVAQRAGPADEIGALLDGGGVEAMVAPGETGEARQRAREASMVAKRRVREARAERDAWRRRAEGADARAERLAVDLERARSDADTLRGELAVAREQLRVADTERERAVDRERRRRDTEVAALENRIAELRREEEQRRTDVRRREEAERQVALDARRSAADAQRRATEDRPPRVVPGRPSRLPRGIEPGTTEAARELLHRGRLVLVDGYNVTKQHRGHLDLETQRNWLVQQLGVLARQRGVVPTVVFDGQAQSGSRPPAALRDVEVRFTAAGITADDELVLAVVATDEPVVVVTDDRELAARVAVSGADVLGTRSFLGVLP